MRLGLTGGLGFVGCRVAQRLIDRGHEPVLIDLAPRSPHPLAQSLLERCEFRACDLTDPDSCERALAGLDGAFHAAALGTKAERELPRETMQLNLQGIANVLEGLRRGGGRRIVFASSAVVYGEGERAAALCEDDRIEDVFTIYAATKLAGEQLVRAYGRQFGVHGVSLRFMNVYGYQPRAWQFRELTARVLERIEDGAAPVIHGDGSSTFDFVHVDDVARAVVIALESDVPRGEFNVGTGRSSSVREIVETLLRLTGSPLQAELHPDIPSPLKRYLADTARARETLGFSAEIDLDEGLRRTIEEFRAHERDA